MAPDHDLMAAYQEWREHTEAEGSAIDRADWPMVARCQQAKRDLQQRIVAATQASRENLSRTGADLTAWESQVRTVVHDLIRLESRNETSLSRRREAMAEIRQSQEAKQRNLTRIRQSYGVTPAPAWQSYS